MPLAFGVELGVDLSRCKRIPIHSGVGDPLQEDLWWNDSPEGGARLDPAVRAMGEVAPIAPLLNETMDIIALGRRDFLAAFKLCCDQRNSTFTLEPYDEPVVDWLRRTGR
jgi:hypothetical protein